MNSWLSLKGKATRLRDLMNHCGKCGYWFMYILVQDISFPSLSHIAWLFHSNMLHPFGQPRPLLTLFQHHRVNAYIFLSYC